MKTTAPWIALAALVLLAAPLTSHAEDGVGKLMDLSFDDTPVAKVIAAIAERSGKNIIMHPGVTGKITIKLQQVGWRAALQQVSQATGARVIEEDFGILRIVPPAPKPAARLPQAYAEAQRRLREIQERIEAAKARGDGDALRVAELRTELARTQAEASSQRAAAARAAAARALGAKVADAPAGKPKPPQPVFPKKSTAFIMVEGTQQVLIVKDDKGNILERRVIGKAAPAAGVGGKARGHDPLASLPLPGNIDILKQRKRLEDLLKARNHLSAAGLHEEARRLHAHVEEARAALAAAEQRRAEAERTRRELEVDRDIRVKFGPAQIGPTAGVAGSIEALRKDVAALRGEVRELTGLVRQLLRRGGGGGRAAGGGAGGRGGR